MTSSNKPPAGGNGEALPPPKPLVEFSRAGNIATTATDWLVDGWLAKNTLAALVGPSGCGKSFLALDLACHISMGLAWHGQRTSRGAVFYLAGEGCQGMRKRIAAWETHYGEPITKAPLYISTGIPFLCSESGAFGVVDAIAAMEDDAFFGEGSSEPVLVIVDTVARAMAGENENTAEAMGRLVRSLDMIRDRWAVTVLALHHTGHASAGRARGSSAFYGAMDSELLVTPRGGSVSLSVTKAKDWSTPPALVLKPLKVEVDVFDAEGSPMRDASLVYEHDISQVAQSQKHCEVLRLFDSGKTSREIEKLTGIARSTAQNWKRKADRSAR